MSNLVLVDSSYYIRLLTLREDPFDQLDEFAGDYDLAICGMIWIEVLRGRSDPHVRKRFDDRFSTMTFLQLTPAAWRRAAGLVWAMDRKGQVIQATDITIAACALEYDAAVLTFDTHFRSVPDLLVVDALI